MPYVINICGIYNIYSTLLTMISAIMKKRVKAYRE